MHIFLDTNAINEDPLWKQNYSSILLKVLKSNIDLQFYISDLVVAEIIKNYDIDSKAAFNRVKNALKELNKYKSKHIDYNSLLNEVSGDPLDNFLKSLFALKNIVLIKTTDYTLRKVFELVKKYEAPYFTKTTPEQKKFEYKDAVIWISYKAWCLKNKIEEAHVLTANTTDWLNKIEVDELVANEKKNGIRSFNSKKTVYRFYKNITDFVVAHPDIFTVDANNYPHWLTTILSQKNPFYALIGKGKLYDIKTFVGYYYRQPLHAKILAELPFYQITAKTFYTDAQVYIDHSDVKVTLSGNDALINARCKFSYHAGFEITPNYGGRDEDPSKSFARGKTVERPFSLNFMINEYSYAHNFEVILDDGIARDLINPYFPPVEKIF